MIEPNNNKPPVDYLENRNDSYVALSDLHMVSDEYLSQEDKYNSTLWGWGVGRTEPSNLVGWTVDY